MLSLVKSAGLFFNPAKNHLLPGRKTGIASRLRSLESRWLSVKKWTYLRLHADQQDVPQTVLFIVGAQRSGTNMLSRVFRRDLRARSLPESCCLTRTGSQLYRLKPEHEVREIISRLPERLVVVKPLVESQHICRILEVINGACALWVFRDYRDVIHSNVKRFTSQVEGVRAIYCNLPNNWRNEVVPARVRSLVEMHWRENMSRVDAAALMWIARNELFFHLELTERPNVRLLAYEDFVRNAKENARSVYRFLGVPYPKRNVVRHVDAQSIGLGQAISLSPAIDRECAELHSRLQTAYRTQQATEAVPVV